jgi:hypothetical protein
MIVIMVMPMPMIVVMMVFVLATFVVVVFVRMFMAMIVRQGQAVLFAAGGLPQDDGPNAYHRQQENAAAQYKDMELFAQHQIEHGHLVEIKSQANAAESPAQGDQA